MKIRLISVWSYQGCLVYQDFPWGDWGNLPNNQNFDKSLSCSLNLPLPKSVPSPLIPSRVLSHQSNTSLPGFSLLGEWRGGGVVPAQLPKMCSSLPHLEKFPHK